MKFYAYMHEFYRRSQREEWNYVENCANYLKNIIVAFWYMAEGEQANQLGGWSKYEGNHSK